MPRVSSPRSCQGVSGTRISVPPAPLPGNIHDPQIMVPTVRSSTEVIRPAKRKQ